MKVSDGEKLILLMLSELYDRLEIHEEIDSEFIRSAIFSNNIWAIPWKYSGIPFEDQDEPEIVKEVLDILDMWNFIEYSYEHLSEKEKEYLDEIVTNPFGKDPKFPGFDGNSESSYMGTASFIVNELDRFEEFKGRNFNSHSPSLDGHGRMLTVFKEIRETINFGPLSVEDLAKILKERVHPSRR
ncbi:YfbU family protein [Psychrobacter immobilis]|uniref:YfbU family protein n=1 Tax=Psychrobacter immobilis TaxID=498 RepID=UPI00191B1A71|nr:YfbU family protein [Psychrobacter immobilis]